MFGMSMTFTLVVESLTQPSSFT